MYYGDGLIGLVLLILFVLLLLGRILIMTLTWTAVAAWLRQPTTVAGIAALVGDGIAVATQAVGWRIELPIAAGSLIAMTLPDNTTAAGLLAKTLRDVLAAIATRDPATIAAAVADAQELVASIEGTTATVTPAVIVTK